MTSPDSTSPWHSSWVWRTNSSAPRFGALKKPFLVSAARAELIAQRLPRNRQTPRNVQKSRRKAQLGRPYENGHFLRESRRDDRSKSVRRSHDGLDRLSTKPFFNQDLGALVYAVSPLRLLKRDNFTVGASKRWKAGDGGGESQGPIAHVALMASYCVGGRLLSHFRVSVRILPLLLSSRPSPCRPVQLTHLSENGNHQ